MSALGGVLGGALGGGIAITALAPLTAANNFLGSYFFGSGMILGERQMYQDDWIKIKKRLDKGESFLTILEEVMKPNTQAVMQMARETVIAISPAWNKIVLDYIQTIPKAIFDAINTLNAGGTPVNPWPLGPGVAGIVNGKVTCAPGWTRQSNNTCTDNTFTGSTTTILDDTPANTPPTNQEIKDKFKNTQDEINKKKDPLMQQYTTFLNKLVQINQQLSLFKNRKTSGAYKMWSANLIKTKRTFETWKKNNKRWMITNGFR